MAEKEKGKLQYEGRVRDTKGIAQRLNLRYLDQPNRFRDLKNKLAWILPAAALAGAIPFLTGVGPADKVFENAPVSRAHKMFEKDCGVCHTKVFSSVPDQACQRCHDGPSHPAKAVDTGKIKPGEESKCSSCHMEHRRDGEDKLADVASGYCTSCHKDLTDHGSGVKLKHTRVTSFREGSHPDFPAKELTDLRPIKVNHKVHMTKQVKTIRGSKRTLPMKCMDCHAPLPGNTKLDLAPVTFDKHCLDCHKRELEFVLPAIGVPAPPAPHTKDGPAIREFIRKTYQDLLAKDPSLALRPLGREGTREPGAGAWLERAARESERYLFEKKCVYCHEYASLGEFPVVKKVNAVIGHYAEAKPEGEPWLPRGEFSHRAHRAVTCASCHDAAEKSEKSADVLIPKLNACMRCHGASGTSIDRCSQCHQYHNKFQETDKDRRPIDELVGSLFGKGAGG